MAKAKIAGPLKRFANLSEVLDGMLERGFFGGYQQLRDEAEASISYDPTSPFSQNEYWFSNGVVELKIFRRVFGAYELFNYRRQSHPDLEAIFELAELRKIS